MNTVFDKILAILALAGMGLVGWYAAYAGDTSAARLESLLERKAEHALLEIGAGWAKVDMDGQSARLTGEAPTEDARAAAETAVRSAAPLELPGLPERFANKGGWLVGGVVAVDNAATVAAPITPYAISAQKTAEGGVSISGHVPDEAARLSIIAAAERFFPGQVAVQLEMGAGVPGPEWVPTFEGLLPLLAQEDVIGAFLTDREISVQALPSAAPAAEQGDAVDAATEAETETEGQASDAGIVLPGLPDGYSGEVHYISDDGDDSDDTDGSAAKDAEASGPEEE